MKPRWIDTRDVDYYFEDLAERISLGDADIDAATEWSIDAMMAERADGGDDEDNDDIPF
jgi:hypothetical protein